MNTTSFDFAVLGGNATSVLLALALAERHGRKVALIGALPHMLEVPVEAPLSVSALVRPDHAALLSRQQGEITDLLGKQGRELLVHLPVAFLLGDGAVGAALQHARQTLAGFGFSTAPLSGEQGELIGFQALGARGLNLQRLEPLLAERMSRAGIVHLKTERADLSLGENEIGLPNDETIAAERIVIVEPRAAKALLPSEALAADFDMIAHTHLVTLPGAATRWPAIVDHAQGSLGLVLPNGRFFVSASGALEPALEWTSRMLTQESGVAGHFTAPRLVSRDGGAVIGALTETGPLVAHFEDMSGAFMAVSLARFLCGEMDELEARFYAQSQPSHTGTRRASDLCMQRGAA